MAVRDRIFKYDWTISRSQPRAKFGIVLEEVLNEVALSEARLAAALEMPLRTIRRWIQGIASPTRESLARLTDAIAECSVNEHRATWPSLWERRLYDTWLDERKGVNSSSAAAAGIIAYPWDGLNRLLCANERPKDLALLLPANPEKVWRWDWDTPITTTERDEYIVIRDGRIAVQRGEDNSTREDSRPPACFGVVRDVERPRFFGVVDAFTSVPFLRRSTLHNERFAIVLYEDRYRLAQQESFSPISTHKRRRLNLLAISSTSWVVPSNEVALPHEDVLLSDVQVIYVQHVKR